MFEEIDYFETHVLCGAIIQPVKIFVNDLYTGWWRVKLNPGFQYVLTFKGENAINKVLKNSWCE